MSEPRPPAETGQRAAGCGVYRGHRGAAAPQGRHRGEVQKKKGGAYTYKYMRLGTLMEAVCPIFAAQGLTLTQESRLVPRSDLAGLMGLQAPVEITTTLRHSSGALRTHEYGALVMPSTAPQDIGSQTTYHR